MPVEFMNNTYKRPYLISIILIALLVIGHQLVIQYWMNQKKSDAVILADSGRQRMLSQKLAALIYHFNITGDSITKEEIFEVHKEIETVHEGLIMGNKAEGVLQMRESYRKELRALSPRIKYINHLIDSLDTLNETQINAFRSNQDFFLKEMERIVKEKIIEVDEKSYSIVISGIVLLGLILFVLYLEHQLVFKRIANQLLSQNEELNEKNKMLEHFAYIASHDLQEPLRTVNNFINAYKEDYGEKMEEGGVRYFDFIQDATQRMKAMIKGLLNYSKAGQSGNFSAVDLNEIIKSIEADLAALVAEKKVILNYPKLPVVNCLKVEINQLFQNLINNAIKFNKLGTQPNINISVKELKKHWQFCVADKGIGISEKNIKSIFQMFKKLHSESKYPGQGLGLAFCKKAVEIHGGEIWVESKEGIGSSFYFTILKK